MDQPSLGATPSVNLPEDRLDSWKEIAAYLSRDVTTVQRWEKREGMPVHRHQHDAMGSVYASRAELDAWVRSRHLRAAQENGNPAATGPEASPVPSPSTESPSIKWRVILPLAAAAVLATLALLWFQNTEYFWRSPIADAKFQTVTDFGGAEQSATISRDGHFVAFLSDRDGQLDVWVTQVGSGQFHNLTRGIVPQLGNPFVRDIGFSPDGSYVTFWVRRKDGSSSDDIGIWAVPTLGGEPKPYLEGAAEYDWSHDGSRLAFHTPGPGDPLFVSDGISQPTGKPIFTAAAGLHSHFPTWSPDGKFLYFVLGSLPDKLDIWRIPAAGGTPQQITAHNASVTYPVLLNRKTLLYLATDADGSGPWLYSMDLDRRIPHRLTSGPEPYTSLAATTDGSRLVATVASPRTTLWSLPIADSPAAASLPTLIPLTTGTGFSPRFGPDCLLYIVAAGTTESIWKFANGTSSQLWSGDNARVFGGPAISPDGRSVAFAVTQNGKTPLYVMQSDGTGARILTDSLTLQGAPAWASDGQSITAAVVDHNIPHLVRITLDGRHPTPLVRDYSVDPAWAPSGSFAVYSGPDIGTTFAVKAVTPEATPHPLPPLTLTRGARHLAFMPGGRALVVLRGGIQHKDLWLIDLDTGAERQLTNFSPQFDIRDFDISPDGHQLVLERVEQHSDVVLLDLPHQ